MLLLSFVVVSSAMMIGTVLCDTTIENNDNSFGPPLTAEEFDLARTEALRSPIKVNVTLREVMALDKLSREDHEKIYLAQPHVERWENGTVPYTISRRFNRRERVNIARAMLHITSRVPCISFVPRQSNMSDFVQLVNGRPGCFAFQGNRGGAHQLNLNRREGCARDVSVIVHELLHSLGADHEHMRPDRDQHIRIVWENISHPWMKSQFWRRSWQGEGRNQTQCREINGPDYDNCVSGVEVQRLDDLPYDLDSVMHYFPTAFGVNNTLVTIVALDGRTDFGFQNGMTELDVKKLSRVYGCD